MERVYPPKDCLAPLLSGDPRILLASTRARVLIDAVRAWPEGLQFEIRTIEEMNQFEQDFDIQRIDGVRTGQGLQVVVSVLAASAAGQEESLVTHVAASETSTGTALRRRTIQTWTPLDITAGRDIRVTAHWVGLFDPVVLDLPGSVLRECAQACF